MTEGYNFWIICFLWAISCGVIFLFIVKKLRAVCGTAVRRRDISLWTDGVVLKSPEKNKARILLLICLIFSLLLFASVTPFGFQRSQQNYNVRAVCCWTHLDLVQCAGGHIQRQKSLLWVSVASYLLQWYCRAQWSGCDTAVVTCSARPSVSLQWPQRPVLIF